MVLETHVFQNKRETPFYCNLFSGYLLFLFFERHFNKLKLLAQMLN